MERLTQWHDGNHAICENESCLEQNCLFVNPCEPAQDIINRLAEYEEAEENGKLFVLPCKIGDTVYWVSLFKRGVRKGVVRAIKISSFGIELEILDDLECVLKKEAEKVYFTRFGAEKALKGADND